MIRRGPDRHRAPRRHPRPELQAVFVAMHLVPRGRPIREQPPSRGPLQGSAEVPSRRRSRDPGRGLEGTLCGTRWRRSRPHTSPLGIPTTQRHKPPGFGPYAVLDNRGAATGLRSVRDPALCAPRSARYCSSSGDRRVDDIRVGFREPEMPVGRLSGNSGTAFGRVPGSGSWSLDGSDRRGASCKGHRHRGSTTRLRFQGCMVIPAGPGGGVENVSGRGP